MSLRVEGQDGPDDEPFGWGEPPAGSDPGPDLVGAPSEPMRNARRFVADRYQQDYVDLLRHIGGAFHCWETSHWSEVDPARLRAELYERFEHACYAANDKTEPFRPNRRKIADLLEAVQAIVQGDAELDAPAWLDTSAAFAPPSECEVSSAGRRR